MPFVGVFGLVDINLAHFTTDPTLPPAYATPLNGVLVDILFNMHIFISFCQSDCQRCAERFETVRQSDGQTDRSDIQPAIFAFGALKKLYKLQGKRAGWQADGLLGIFFFRGVSAWRKQENLEIRFFNILCSHHSILWP